MKTSFYPLRSLNPLFYLIPTAILLFGEPATAQTDSLMNRVSIGYDVEKHPSFNGYAATVEYARKTTFGTALAKLQQGSRFNQAGWAAQAEYYPQLGKKSYGCAAVMLSDGKIFPKFSAAAHWMPILRGGVELEFGTRFISVNTEEKAWLGIFGVTKYWRNWFFNPKLYVATGSHINGQTATLTIRRYNHDDASYLFLNTGISKTNQPTVYQNLLFNTFQFNARWLQAGIHQKISTHWAIDLAGGFENFESTNSEVRSRWLGSTKLSFIF
jgi:YaiO family outer membrane protein